MSFDLNSYKKIVEDILRDYPSIRLAETKDEEQVHRVLESVSMKLQDGLELLYSRRPDLIASYQESLMRPIIFTDQKAESATATISQMDYFSHGNSVPGFYSSDLRMSEKTPLAVKKDFGTLYAKLVASIPASAIFATAVLKENLRAMKLFSKLSQNIHYNPYFEIVTRSLVILPFAKLKIDKGFPYKIAQAQEYEKDLQLFLQRKITEANFSHDILSARSRLKKENEFVILNDKGQIEAYFSLYQTTHRKILIKAKSKRIRLLLFVIKTLSGNDLKVKIPWTYINNLIVDGALEKRQDLLTQILSFIIKSKKVKSGELLSFTHLLNEDSSHFSQEGKGQKNFLGLPQISTETVFFKVESQQQACLVDRAVIVDPTLL
jgi:hypothetical protein